MNRALCFTCLAVLTLTTGCEKVDSTNVKTDGIFASLQVNAFGNGKSQVAATLVVGGASSDTYLELGDGDHLNATAAGVTKELKAGAMTYATYEATFDTEAAGEVVIAFDREADDGAPHSVVSLPAPFEITAPAKGAELSRTKDSLTFRWTPGSSTDSVSWSVAGGCIERASGLTPDTGELTLGPGALHAREAGERSGDVEASQSSCEVLLSIERTSDGTVDPAFGEGGRFVATQSRTETFRSIP